MHPSQSSESSPNHLWIGGSPCSGKSTVAATLAAASGRVVYSCDDAWDRHSAAATGNSLPVLHDLSVVATDVRLRRPVGVQVDDVVAAYREQFPSILADVRDAPPTVLEGAALLPDLLAGIDVPADRAVWLVPSETFQRAHYARRTWAFDLLADAPDAADLFEAWMQRDAAFAAIVADQARDHGYDAIVVDGSRTVDELTALVNRRFGLSG